MTNTTIDSTPTLPTRQRVVQICLYLGAAIALFGGTLQMVMGQPDTTPRLDNVHRFLAGVYFGAGIISFWTARTVRQHGTLIYLLAFAVFMGAVGRLVSMSQVGLPQPTGVWLAYLVSELVLPVIIVIAHPRTNAPRSPSQTPAANAVAGAEATPR